MTDQGETFQRISVAEAARHLGVSAATVRRRIRAGELEAATVLRTQGTAFVVRLPLDACAGVADAYDREQGPGSSTRAQASGPEVMTPLIQTTIATVLGPLVAELAASRQANERQADELKELARENGRQSAELEAARARILTLEASGAPHTVEAAPPGPFWSRWRTTAPWLLLVVILLLAFAVGQPAWVRW